MEIDTRNTALSYITSLVLVCYSETMCHSVAEVGFKFQSFVSQHLELKLVVLQVGVVPSLKALDVELWWNSCGSSLSETPYSLSNFC